MATSKQYKYQFLKASLIGQISSGAFGLHGRIDSESQLSRRFNLSKNTIRQALQVLENEGYLYRIQGKGTFVRHINDVKARKIALLIYDVAYMAHPVTGGLICGIDKALKEEGFILDILASKRSFHEESLTELAKNYAGFLIGTFQLDELTFQELEKLSLPYLFVKNYPVNRKTAAVRVDYKRAGFLAAEHLIQTGCHDLGLIYSGEEIAISAEFKLGVCTAALEYGARLRTRNTFAIEFSERSAVPKIVENFISQPECPDGIICISDELAVTLLEELKSRDISVPGDISVLGCNNTEIAAMTVPPLTTINIPVAELGRAAAVLLLGMISGKEQILKIPEPKLIVRGSTKKKEG